MRRFRRDAACAEFLAHTAAWVAATTWRGTNGETSRMTRRIPCEHNCCKERPVVRDPNISQPGPSSRWLSEQLFEPHYRRPVAWRPRRQRRLHAYVDARLGQLGNQRGALLPRAIHRPARRGASGSGQCWADQPMRLGRRRSGLPTGRFDVYRRLWPDAAGRVVTWRKNGRMCPFLKIFSLRASFGERA